MTVLDAFAVLAFLKGEPAAVPVQELLRSDEAALTVVGVAEVVDHLVRLVGVDEEEVALDLAQLSLDDPRPLTEDTARRAGLLRARHYHRRSRPVSLADCVAAESARSLARPLATADPDLLDLCREEGIEVVPLPDSQGRIWSG